MAACSRNQESRKQDHLARGERALAAGRPQDAVIEFRNAIQIDPMFAEARLKLADTFADLGDSFQALNEYIRAADLRPDDTDLQIKTGHLLLAVGRVDDAKARADAVLQRRPDHVEAHILLGNALGGIQDLDGALAQMEEAIRLDPERAASQVQLGIVQLARGRAEEAEAALQKAIALSPRWIGGPLALANFYWASGRLAEANMAIDTALTLDPNHEGANRAKAVLSFAVGERALAETHLKRVVELADSPAPRLTLADYYLAVGRPNDAIAQLEPLAGDARLTALAAPRLARAHATAGNRAQARELVDAMLKKDPQDAVARTLHSQILLDEGKLEEALSTARAAVDAAPGSAAAQYTLGRAYAALGDSTGAEVAFREVLKINPRATPAHVELSTIHLSRGASGESIQLAETAAKLQPQNFAARIALARSLVAAGEWQRAERELTLLQNERPTAAGFVQVGALEIARNNVAAARAALDAALRLDAGSVEAIAGHLALDLKTGDHAGARERLKQHASNGASPQLLMLAGQTYVSMNDLPEAERVLQQAIERQPSALAAYSMLGQLYIRQNKLEQARVEFDRLATKHSRPVGALTMSGTILQVQGKIDDARQRYERALTLDPAAPVAANNLAWIYADSKVQLDRAIELAQKALERLPELPEVLDTLGWAHYQNQQPAMAVRYFDRCIKVASTSQSCHYHAGLAHAALGNTDAARASFGQALAGPKNSQFAALAQKALAAMPAGESRTRR